MAYWLHDVTCAYGHPVVVCTDQEDGFSSDDFFEFECPTCGEEVKFNPGVVKESRRCPRGAVRGYLVDD